MSELYWSWIPVVDGVIGIVADRELVRRIYYLAEAGDLERQVRRDFPCARQTANDLLKTALTQLQEYFDGSRVCFDLPLCLDTLSPFGRKVLQALSGVPYGEIVTYAELARLAGAPRAARAVGRIMASNPFPIVVPCHRVILTDGQYGNYSGAAGVQTKRRLIETERNGHER